MIAWPRRSLFGITALLAAPHNLRAQAARQGWPRWLDRWEEVLQQRVDDRGRVDFAAIAAAPGPLQAVVAEIEQAGPRNEAAAFPSAADVLAYHLNAYNATAMLGIVRRGIPNALGLAGRYQFFANTTIRIAGANTTLKSYEDDVIRRIGEERVHFALNCMVRGCPRLPREAFRPERLEAQLAAAAREFCSSSYQVRPNRDTRMVQVSQIFDFFTGDFVPAKAPSLIAYINRWRREPIPADWAVRFFDYDWTINRQPGSAGGGG